MKVFVIVEFGCGRIRSLGTTQFYLNFMVSNRHRFLSGGGGQSIMTSAKPPFK